MIANYSRRIFDTFKINFLGGFLALNNTKKNREKKYLNESKNTLTVVGCRLYLSIHNRNGQII